MEIKNKERLQNAVKELQWARDFAKGDIVVQRNVERALTHLEEILKEEETESEEQETEKAILELEKAAGMIKPIYH